MVIGLEKATLVCGCHLKSLNCYAAAGNHIKG